MVIFLYIFFRIGVNILLSIFIYIACLTQLRLDKDIVNIRDECNQEIQLENMHNAANLQYNALCFACHH